MHHNMRIEEVAETIERNSAMVYRLAFSMVKSVQDAEDIHQEVFMRYIRKNLLFESNEHERAWFIRITTNLCKNLWKSAWRQKMVSVDTFENEESNDYNTEPLSKANLIKTEDLRGNVQLTEKEETVVEAVKRLPIQYRAVIHLFYYEEMSIEEIATALKLRPSNVRTRLTRARRMLKEWLKEDV